MKALQEHCETAYNIPQYSEGIKIFGIGTDNKFVMAEDEGHHLQELLEQIADERIQTLAEKFDERVEKAGEIQQAWSDLCDFKAAWQKINECLEQYKKISKNVA